MTPDGGIRARMEPTRRRRRLTFIGTAAILLFGMLCVMFGEAEAAPSVSYHRYNKRNGHQNYAETGNTEDEDVLELEHLKHVQPEAATDDAALERELAIASDSAMSDGGRGANPHAPRLANQFPPKEDGGKVEVADDADVLALNAAAAEESDISKPTPKTYHGAARLAFGQNPEPVVSSQNNTPSTPTEHTNSATTDTPSTINPTHTDAKHAVDSATATPPISDAIRTADEMAAFDEFTHNGQRRSISSASKDPEMLLMRHSGGQVSSLDMAQYVFWTGDEEGVARAVEEFIQKGLMSREDAIKLLREISLGIEYLENSFNISVMQKNMRGTMADNSIDQSSATAMKRRSSAMPTRPAKSARYNTLSTTAFTLPPSTTTTVSTTPITSTTTEITILSTPAMIEDQESNMSPNQQQTNPINIPLYSKLNDMLAKRSSNADVLDNSLGYMEISEKLRLADSLYAAYSLEETIYQLAKVMFFQTLTTGSQQGNIALQRLTAFLEAESAQGRVSPVLQKRIIDVLLAALSDCLAEHPDLIPAAREGLGAALDRLPKNQAPRSQLSDAIH